MSAQESTIKAPTYPSLLRASEVISDLDRRTKGSPANLLVPTSIGTMLNRWGYGETTSPSEKAFAALDIGVPEASKLAPLLGIFIGPVNKKAREAAADALRRLDIGEDAAAVWKDTLWGRHPTTGQPITELDDSVMQLHEQPPKPGDPAGLLVDSVYHPEYSQYVDTYSDMGLSSSLGDWDFGGAYYPSRNSIEMGGGLAKELNEPGGFDRYMETLVHEMEHGAQKKYGFPGGADPDTYAYIVEKALKDVATQATDLVQKHGIQNFAALQPDKQRNAMLRQIADPTDRQKMSDLLAQWRNLRDESYVTTDRYRNTSGEAMARLAGKRKDLTAEQRREIYPFDKYGFANQTDSNISSLFNPEDYTQFLGLDLKGPKIKDLPSKSVDEGLRRD